MRNLSKLVALLMVAMLLAVACGGDEAAQEGDTITIGALHPLTGPLAVDGTRMEEAARLAVDDINEQGGIEALDGAELELMSADTEGEPEVAQSEAQRMAQEGVVAIVGSYTSPTAATIARTAERSQVPFVIDVAAADSILEQGYSYVFRIQPNATSMGEFGVRYLREIGDATNTPVETVAYVHENSEYGTSVFQAFNEAAADEGIEVASDISYDFTQVSDLTSELTRAAAANPDIIVHTGYYNDGLLFADAAASVQPDVEGIYGVANGAFDLEQFPEDRPDRSNYYLSSNYHFDATSDRVNELRERFEERTDQSMRTAAVFSYQAVEIIADALERAGSAEPQEVRDAIAETSLQTELFPFDGPIEFDDTGQNVNAQPIVMQVQDERIVQVFPEEYAQEDPVFPATPWAQE